MPKNPQWTSEQAREAAKLSHLARAANKEKDPATRATELVRAATPALMGELLKAARGEEEFEGLTPAARLSAIIKALEYGVGRPTAAPKGEDQDIPANITPESLFGASEVKEELG
jgi:hypothetical protein